MITAKQAARLRFKLKTGKIGPSEQRRLDEYEASKPKRGPKPKADPVEGDPAPEPEPDPEAQPQPIADDLPPPPPPEAPPRVAPDQRAEAATPAASSPSSRGGKGGDWRDKYRHGAGDDPREMVCEFVGGSWHDAVVALAGDLHTAKIKPWPMDPAPLRGLFILATDEILPPQFRMTPKIAAAIETTAIVGQRFYHKKKIAEALKHSPEHQEWLRKQAEAEAADQAQRAAASAEQANQGATPTHPDPAPEPAPLEPTIESPVTVAGTKTKPKPAPMFGERPDAEPLY